jgi:hypothetical protein
VNSDETRTALSQEESVLEGMRKNGWSEPALAVVRLLWEYEAIPVEGRSVSLRRDFGLRMLDANMGSHTMDNGWPAPEPLEQLRIANQEYGQGLPHAYFPRTPPTSEARAYSEDTRSRIWGVATAVVTLRHTARREVKLSAEKAVAAILAKHGFTSSSGQMTEGHAGLQKHCLSAEQGRASFQSHYDYAMRFAPQTAPGEADQRIEFLTSVLITLCRDWRLWPQPK